MLLCDSSRIFLPPQFCCTFTSDPDTEFMKANSLEIRTMERCGKKGKDVAGTGKPFLGEQGAKTALLLRFELKEPAEAEEHS